MDTRNDMGSKLGVGRSQPSETTHNGNNTGRKSPKQLEFDKLKSFNCDFPEILATLKFLRNITSSHYGTENGFTCASTFFHHVATSKTETVVLMS